MEVINDEGLTRRINSSDTVNELEAACRAVTASLGFEGFFYAVRVANSMNSPATYSLSGYPPEWVTHYDNNKYLAIDPVVAYMLQHASPVCWDEIPRDDAVARRFFAEAAAHGIVHGMTVPVSGRPGEFGLFSLCRPQPLPGDGNDRLSLVCRCQWFAGHIHRSYCRIVIAADEQRQHQVRLTRRENECLRWAADGLTTAQIAEKLSIRERTVHFHLQNVIDKMQVSGRQHAIARAINLGLLLPPDFSEVRCKDPIPTIAESRPS